MKYIIFNKILEKCKQPHFFQVSFVLIKDDICLIYKHVCNLAWLDVALMHTQYDQKSKDIYFKEDFFFLVCWLRNWVPETL